MARAHDDIPHPRKAAARSSGDPGLPRLHTVAVVAERLSTSERTIHRLIDRGELAVHRIGRSVRIAEDDLQAYLRQVRG